MPRQEVELAVGINSLALAWKQANTDTRHMATTTPMPLIVFALTLSSLATLEAADTSRPGRPNIISIMADDLGYTVLTCSGSKYMDDTGRAVD